MTVVNPTGAPASGQPLSLIFVKSGNVLLIQGGVEHAAPDDVFALLHDHLSFDQIEFLYGSQARDPNTGKKRRVSSTTKRLYDSDQLGRLRTNFGFLNRCYAVLKGAGYAISYFDFDKQAEAAHPRPRRYEPNFANVERHFQYRPKQLECLQAVAKSLQGGVHAITGFGKRVMIAMECLLYPHAKIHIVVRGIPLVNALVDELCRYIPNIGQFGGGKKHFGDRITVFSRDSLKHSDFDADFLLGDEAHSLVTDEAAPILARYQRTRNFGHTATASGRSDGSDPRIEALFGPTIFYIPYWEGVQLGLVSPIRVEWRDVFLNRNPAAGLDDPVQRQRRGIWFNDERNDLIAKDVLKVPHDEQLLVLTDTLYHAVELYKRLRGAERPRELVLVYDAIDAERLAKYKDCGDLPRDTPKMTAQQKEVYRKRFEAGEIDAVATKTWEVGIDPVYLQQLFITASFRSEIKSQQAPGRASRVNQAGKEAGIVHDYRDQFDDGFHSAANVRSSVYASDSLRWEQVVVHPNGTFTPL